MISIKRGIWIILSLIPIEFLGMIVDYKTYTMWGYIPFIIILIILGCFSFDLKSYFIILISRLLGILISWKCSDYFINWKEAVNYFKPFDNLSFIVFLGIIGFGLLHFVMLVFYTLRRGRN